MKGKKCPCILERQKRTSTKIGNLSVSIVRFMDTWKKITKAEEREGYLEML